VSIESLGGFRLGVIRFHRDVNAGEQNYEHSENRSPVRDLVPFLDCILIVEDILRPGPVLECLWRFQVRFISYVHKSFASSPNEYALVVLVRSANR
jgi:hypothetical protein